MAHVLAAGRDADVFATSGSHVLRRYRDGRDARWEARLMHHLAAHGYPVPAVRRARGPEIVMERVHGPTMLEDLVRHPARILRHARTLRELHAALHRIPAPPDLPVTRGGSSVAHLDLHPGNVILSPTGPVVIDWTNAAAAPADADVAKSWLVIATSPPAGGAWDRLATTAGRGLFLRLFLRGFDRARAAEYLPAVAEERLRVPGLVPDERERIDKLVARQARRHRSR